MKHGGAPLLLLEEALAEMRRQATPVRECEQTGLAEGLGRVLGADLQSPVTVPGFDNSAMDGYAFRAADVTAGVETLPVRLRVAAGDPPGVLAPGTACRIFTGAPLPSGADTVVIQEQCGVRDDQVVLPAHWTPGAHIRRAGEDIEAGAVILRRGQRLDPPAVGLAASCGFTRVTVVRRLRVAVLSTGDELRPAGGAALRPGQIYDSNRPMLQALLARLGCELRDAGHLGDDREATRTALRAAASTADVIVTTGGVSVGEEDHVKAAVEAEGSLSLWRVAIKPGKPIAFGRIGASYFMGLPGNPVSAFVTFLLFVQPFLRALQGEPAQPWGTYPVRAAFTRLKPDNRREFLRARLDMRPDGSLWAEAHARQSSGVLSSVVWAHGLVDIPAGRTVAEGDTVSFIPFGGLAP